ncbi:hypothetical protein BDP27DRAFT_1312224 [Rhodocollybia butyracea]|uniref:F-box domain-containing protein n=1 Tax=Rhodocollybia butyracea TaxID=206335 RepID=A0A9P5Q9V0_9AGAR|nr:hypothetical protein BDP27DRAFT_1312224 [Rhodocollybia butyracea]
MLCEKCNTSVPDAPPNTSPDFTFSSLQNLLRDQNSLTPSRTSEIRDIIAGLDVDTDRIRWELISLTNKLKRLEIQRAKYKSLLAPVRRMPSEILNLIFTLFACDPDTRNNFRDNDGITLPGYTLMAVCSRWRNISLSCTALWRKLWLNAFLMSNNNEQGLNDLARLAAPLKWCLDHAGETEPLEICFVANMDVQNTPIPDPEFMRILLAQSARWGRLDLGLINLTNLESFPSLAALKNCALTSLKSLNLCIPNEGSEGLTRFDIFRNAPQLTQLTLSILPTVERKEMFPWGQIKTLELAFIDPNYELFSALAFCTHLESLSYVFSDDYNESYSFEIPPQTSETVRSLSLSFGRGHCVPETFTLLMNAACFPALQEMSISYEELLDRDILWPQDKFISFLVRSGCSLTTLEIENIAISNDSLVSLLVNTPELRRFNFYEKPVAEMAEMKKKSKAPTSKHQHITMSFIARLHAYYGDIEDGNSHGLASPIVPKLEHLSLRVLADWFDIDHLFIDVVCSRWSPEPSVVAMTGVQCLKSVKLKVLGRNLNEEVYRPLIQLRKAGLQVDIVCGTDSEDG